jgi:hypothetical protein
VAARASAGRRGRPSAAGRRRLLHRVRDRLPGGRRSARARLAGDRRARGPGDAAAAARAARVGAGGNRRLLEDLHPCGLRARALPPAAVRADERAARHRLPLPLLGVRPADGRQRGVRSRRPRPPQLPLEIGPGRELLAGGGFSGPIGPSWWAVRRS